MQGIMVTHFSRGSFLASHGFDTSPFLIRLLWKKRFGRAENPEVDPQFEVGRGGGSDGSGDSHGVISSAVPSRGGGGGERAVDNAWDPPSSAPPLLTPLLPTVDREGIKQKGRRETKTDPVGTILERAAL